MRKGVKSITKKTNDKKEKSINKNLIFNQLIIIKRNVYN